MINKILAVGAIAALITTPIEAIEFNKIRSTSLKNRLKTMGLKDGMDRLEAAGVPVWSYFKAEQDFVPLITAKKQGKDPLAVYWAQVEKEASQRDLAKMNQGQATAAARAMKMDSHSQIKSKSFPQPMQQLLDVVGRNYSPSSAIGKRIIARYKPSEFRKSYVLKDPYYMMHLLYGKIGTHYLKIKENEKFIPFYNQQILLERKPAIVNAQSKSTEFWEEILPTFYIMVYHKNNIPQKATNDGTDQTPELLLTVTGVNDQGYRVSYVDQDGKFQHAFVPEREIIKKYKSFKIGQLLIAKVSLAQPGMLNAIGMGNRLVPQRQVFDFPPALTITDQPDGFPEKTVKIFQDEAQRTTYPVIVPGSISKGAIPRHRR